MNVTPKTVTFNPVARIYYDEPNESIRQQRQVVHLASSRPTLSPQVQASFQKLINSMDSAARHHLDKRISEHLFLRALGPQEDPEIARLKKTFGRQQYFS